MVPKLMKLCELMGGGRYWRLIGPSLIGPSLIGPSLIGPSHVRARAMAHRSKDGVENAGLHKKVAAGPPQTPRPSAAYPHLKYMSIYGWETTLTAGMAGWLNVPIGPPFNRSNPLVAQTADQLVVLTAMMAQAHAKYNLSAFWALPPGLILPGAVRVQPDAFSKLATIAKYVRPLVATGAVKGFFLGDEQCGNSSCVVNQLGVVASRIHDLFDDLGADTGTHASTTFPIIVRWFVIQIA